MHQKHSWDTVDADKTAAINRFLDAKASDGIIIYYKFCNKFVFLAEI
jgi:hypothetical protein